MSIERREEGRDGGWREGRKEFLIECANRQHFKDV